MDCELIIICAVAADGAIGRNGDLAFHISADLKRFKALTMSHTVVMGRKTFESLPKGALPGRRNIVITRNPQWLSEFSAQNAASNSPKRLDGVIAVPSLEDAISLASDAGESQLFVIGGGQIYAAALPLANRLEITEIDATAPDADTFFPPILPSRWQPTDPTTPWLLDPNSPLPYRFLTYLPAN